MQLLSIVRSQLTITLQSEVTNGNVCLVFGNGTGDVIGRVPVPSVLTTNKWQMVSFTADIRTRANLQIYVQVRTPFCIPTSLTRAQPMGGQGDIVRRFKGTSF